MKQGSTFIVELPAGIAPARSRPDPTPASLIQTVKQRKRVLIVDDNTDARVLLGDLLAMSGHEVKTAGDGPEALALLDTFDADVAVLDIGLPGMNGLELATKVRALRRGPSVRLLAMTGYGQPSDKAASREVGFDQHLVKPVDIDQLLELISSA